MKQKIRWAILGLGKIANTLAKDLQLSSRAELYAVASRSLDKAEAFSRRHRAVKYFGSYEALLAETEIDVVYIASPHAFHYEHSMMFLKRGKAVLCEKPMGLDSKQVMKMVETARKNQTFLMEGLWTRFIPGTEKLLELLGSGVIGTLRSVHADFGFRADYDPGSRLFNKALGGGSLMDIGIYPILLSLLSLGLPAGIHATARMTDTGIDSYCSMQFDYENGARAALESSFESDTPTEAKIVGSKGSIILHQRFHHTEKLSLRRNGETEVFEIPYRGNGYLHEIEEVNACLQLGLKESKKLPLSFTLDLISLIDRVKKEIGLDYS